MVENTNIRVSIVDEQFIHQLRSGLCRFNEWVKLGQVRKCPPKQRRIVQGKRVEKNAYMVVVHTIVCIMQILKTLHRLKLWTNCGYSYFGSSLKAINENVTAKKAINTTLASGIPVLLVRQLLFWQ